MTIKILILAFDYRPRLGGVATCSFELAQALSRLPDVEVKVLAPSYATHEQSTSDGNNNFSCDRINLPARAWLAVIPLTLRLINLKRKFKPDAVISMLWFPEGLANFLASLLFGNIPQFIFAHGVELMESQSTFKKRIRGNFRFIKSAVFQFADKIFAVSRFTKDQIASQCKTSTDQIIIVNNGVDLNTFIPAKPKSELIEKYNLQDKKIFLTITRLNDYKGIDYVIKALSKVLQTHPHVQYLVGGTGPDHDRLLKITNELQMQNNVTFLGKIPNNQLVDFYNLADCFILNTRTDWETPNCEGFGIVFLEAAACEKPIIAGNSGGIPDAVDDKKNGWLVNPEDELEIAKVMIHFLDFPDEGIKFGKLGRERVQTGFTWKHAAEKVLTEVKKHVRN